MIRFTAFFLMLALAGCTTEDQPQEDINYESGPGPYNFNCDVPSGHFLQTNIATSSKRTKITGKMQFVTFRSDPNWSPMAAVFFVGSKTLPRPGLQAYRLPSQADKIQLAVRGSGMAADDSKVFTTIPLTTEPIPFEMKIDDSGQLDLSIAGERKSLSMTNFNHTRVSLACSTALVRFSDINVIAENE